jgi:hypothetical protein
MLLVVGAGGGTSQASRDVNGSAIHLSSDQLFSILMHCAIKKDDKFRKKKIIISLWTIIENRRSFFRLIFFIDS